MHIFTCFFSKSIPMTCRVIVVAFADKPLAVERNFCLLSAWVNMWPSGRTSCWNKKWHGNKGVWYFLSRISVVEEILFFFNMEFLETFFTRFSAFLVFFFFAQNFYTSTMAMSTWPFPTEVHGKLPGLTSKTSLESNPIQHAMNSVAVFELRSLVKRMFFSGSRKSPTFRGQISFTPWKLE